MHRVLGRKLLLDYAFNCMPIWNLVRSVGNLVHELCWRLLVTSGLGSVNCLRGMHCWSIRVVRRGDLLGLRCKHLQFCRRICRVYELRIGFILVASIYNLRRFLSFGSIRHVIMCELHRRNVLE